jgi:hypothetical protein
MPRPGILQFIQTRPEVHEQLIDLAMKDRRTLAAVAGLLLEYGLNCMKEKSLNLSDILKTLPPVELTPKRPGRKKKKL